MKMKKFLVGLLVVCVLFGCMSMTALAQENESIAVDETKTITVEASGGSIVEGSVSYCFTPEESGTYFMTVSYTENEQSNHVVMFYVDDGEEYFSFGDMLVFEAVAGESYVLTVDYFGAYEETMDYVVAVNGAQPLEGIALSVDKTVAPAGIYLYIDVIYQPEFGEREELIWTVSDPSVAELEMTYTDYAELYLLSAGTVTVTATTASGKSASIDITVEAVEYAEFVLGDNAVSITGGNSQPFTFAPEQSGYYTIRVDHPNADCGLSAETVYDDTDVYYILEAGEIYEGEAYAWIEDDLEFTVTIEYHEGLEFPMPVAMEITKLPDQTTYLKEYVQNLWSDDCLAGMELKLTWADGTVTDWSYDENNGKIGIYSVGGFLNEKEDGGCQVEVCIFGDDELEPVFFDLTVLDIVPQSITLVDSTPLQIVENSCGFDLSDLPLIMEAKGVTGWFYLPFAAYNREVVITFSDGSTVNAMPGEYVYGLPVYYEDNQYDHLWTKDSDNKVEYYYGDVSTELAVEIVDSPVQSIELLTPPKNNTVRMDEEFNMFGSDGEMLESFRQMYEGMSLKVNYKDGSSKTFAAEDIQWVELDGMEYPFVDGYPVDVLRGMLGMMQEDVVPPCEIEISVEYMGAADTYILSIVEEFPTEDDTGDDKDDNDQPVIEPIPGTGDADMAMGVTMLVCLMGMAVVITRKKNFC